MRKNYITLSSGYEKQTQERIMAVFTTFLPIITAVDQRFAARFDSENSLYWEIQFPGHLPCELKVAWMGPCEREHVLTRKGDACIRLTDADDVDDAVGYVMRQILKDHPVVP